MSNTNLHSGGNVPNCQQLQPCIHSRQSQHSMQQKFQTQQLCGGINLAINNYLRFSTSYGGMPQTYVTYVLPSFGYATYLPIVGCLRMIHNPMPMICLDEDIMSSQFSSAAIRAQTALQHETFKELTLPHSKANLEEIEAEYNNRIADAVHLRDVALQSNLSKHQRSQLKKKCII